VSLYKQGKWSELYDLTRKEKGATRADFVREMGDLVPLLQFRPVAMGYNARSKDWVIRGCARFLERSGHELSALSSMRAQHVGSDWLFGIIALDVLDGPMVEGNPCAQ
jgi:hypothetical protein